MVRAGAPAFLPSASERGAGVRLMAALVEPGQPARETLIVYGFRDQADFERVRPTPGAAFEDGTHAAAQLTAQMDELPLQRWTRSIVSYLITPKDAP